MSTSGESQETHLEITDPQVWIDCQQGRRNALVVRERLPVRKADIISIGLAGDSPEHAIRRRIQFVDTPDPDQPWMVLGLEWVDGGAMEAVRRKVCEATSVPHYRLGMTRNRQVVSPAERSLTLMTLFAEIRRAVGGERFDAIPAEMLDQFCVMSLSKNHDTHGLLNSLINSFMIAYGVPETNGPAFDALLKIEKLRAEVGRLRQRDRERAFKRSATH